MTRIARTFTLLALFALPFSAPAGAQTPAAVDTPTVQVPGVTVTGLRGREHTLDVPAATFVLPKAELRRAGVARLSTMLATLPGLNAYRQTSNGDFGVVDPRGFTASGESSYLKLLVNGHDVRDSENGDVDWDWVLPDDVERVEVIQGPGAWAYGDASEGGIVNIVRPDPAERFTSDCAARFGSFGLVSGGIGVSGTTGDWGTALRGGGRAVEGWRQHSHESVWNGGVEAHREYGDMRVVVDASLLQADRQDPGTLTSDQVQQDPEQSETTTDYEKSMRGVGGLRFQGGDEAKGAWTIAPYTRLENVDQIRTLFFQPLVHETEGMTAGVQGEWRRASGESRPLVWSANGEAEQTRLDSRYEEFLGDVEGATVANVQSHRTTWAGSVGVRAQLSEHTIARASVRGDVAQVRAEDELAGTSQDARTMSAVSPMLAITQHLTRRASMYISGSSAFRVPTLNQLYDRRPIFAGVDSIGNPVFVYLSNPQLDPQRSTNVEIGGRWEGEDAWATLTLYSMWVRNEIDFDIATLSYANISSSWHRGIQAAAQGPLAGGVSVVLSGAWQPTTFREGANDGKQINGVPIGTLYGALRWSPVAQTTLEAGIRAIGEQFLDKEELHPLAAYSTLEAAVSGRIGRLRGTVRGSNLLDHEYSDTGFIGAFGEERFSPAAPRSFTVSLSLD